MTVEERSCDVVEEIIEDLEATIETLEKTTKKFEYFHSESFDL